MSDRTLTASLGREGYTTVMSTRSHTLVADEPLEVGGTDVSASPYEYLMASLASCTAITLRMYADRKAWPLEGVDVTIGMSGDKAPTLSRTIEVRGPLDEAQRARLLDIAAACPVSRILTSGIPITAGDQR